MEGSGVAVWGRLQPGLTPKVAEDELRSLAALRPQHPNGIWENESLPSQPGGYVTGMMSGSHHGTGAKDPDLMAPVAATIGALVLLILAVACGNLSSLLLARGVAREREIAIRIAVGAGKGRLVRQLFTESLLLGLLGSVAGLGVGYVVLRSLAPGDARAIVVSQSVAVAAWPAEDPIGRPLQLGDVKYTVVGISGNARVAAPQDPDAVEGYFLAGAPDLPSMVVLVKTSGPPEALARSLASIAKTIDPKILPEVQLMKSAFRRTLENAEYGALSVTLLASVALLLACLGIVGLVAYAVSQRTKEIGIRMAPGAKPSHILSIVLRQFARPVVAGLLVGVGGAAGLSQILRRILYGIGSLDPIAYLAAIGLFTATVALAALLPARRALRVDPMRALRCD